jgi:protein-disulfide isomerase
VTLRRFLKAAAALTVVAAAAATAAPVRHKAPVARAKAPAPRAKAPVARDWSRTVLATPEGGFRMGNPAARVKLVEYGSLTCPHCAHFSETGTPALVAQYVRTGKVSYEYRNFILNGIDAAAVLLARCGGAAHYFPFVEQAYATQKEWLGRVGALSAAQKAQLQALPEGQRLGKVADFAGLYTLAARNGVTPARGKQCLADTAALDRLGKMYEAASALGVTGTPTFFVNGRRADTNEWSGIEPLIRQAGG